MKGYQLIVLCFFFSTVFAQEAEMNWEQKGKIALAENSVWHADVLGNVYVVEKDVIAKYDTSGQKNYSQSIKSLGRIQQIESINALKLVLFSEEQQLIAFTDNTLTSIQERFSLSELGFAYVTMITPSSQPNKLWIYDQINSKITLLDLSGTNQSQEIENLRGLLKSSEIIWVKEANGKLLIMNKTNNLFVFDRYGSLLDAHKMEGIERFDYLDDSFLVEKDGEIKEYDLLTKTFASAKVPLDNNLKRAEWKNPFFFVQEEDSLIKYKRILAD